MAALKIVHLRLTPFMVNRFIALESTFEMTYPCSFYKFPGQSDHVPVDAQIRQSRRVRSAVAIAEIARSAAAEAFLVVAAVISFTMASNYYRFHRQIAH